MSKVLLVYPSSTRTLYSESKVKHGVPEIPSLSLATVAASLISKHDVKVLDLGLFKDPSKILEQKLSEFNPNYVGITLSTPQYNEVKEIVGFVKEFDDEILTVAGGPHVSALPVETLKDSELDVAVVGEGDFVLPELVSQELKNTNGICFKKDSEIVSNPPRQPISDLDKLPYPAMQLFDIKKYKTPRIICKKNPVGSIETSRGCVFNCTYCNKSVFGRKFTFKSPERVVDEMEYLLGLGFKEFQILDDGFSFDMERAKRICDLIVERGLNFPWNLQNGIRVDRVDEELLEKAYSAGCHRVTFGVESGNQRLLNNVNKGVTLEQTRNAFKIAHKVGIKTMAYFMIALPGETEQTMQETIEFAKELGPDLAKLDITTPFPGTKLFEEWDKKGYIKSRDWNKYNTHDPSGVFEHPNLSWEKIFEYYDKFYREFYLGWRYAKHRVKTGLLNGEMFYHMYYLFRIKW